MKKSLVWLSFFNMLLILGIPIVAAIPSYFPVDPKTNIISFYVFHIDRSIFFFLQLFGMIMSLVIYGLISYFKFILPSVKYDRARNEILDALLKPDLESFFPDENSIRVMIHRAKLNLYRLGFWHKLVPIYRWGYQRQNRDYHLIMSASRIFKRFKGNCGLAFLEEEPQLADLTVKDPFDYHLSKSEIKQTKDILGIISVPVFEKPTGNRTPKAIGVISIDTNNKDVMDRWVEDHARVQEIVAKIEDHAKVASVFL